MERRAHALIAGLFVLLVAALGAGLFWWLHAERSGDLRSYRVVGRHSVSGVVEESRVSFRGVPVGTVRRIGLDPGDPDRVVIDIAVRREAPVGDRTYAVVEVEGVTGSAHLALKNDGEPGTALATAAERPAEIPLRPSLLDSLGESGRGLVREVRSLVAEVRQLVENPDGPSLAGIVANADRLSSQLIELQETLARSVATIPSLTRRGAETLENLDRTLDHADQVIVRVGRDLEGLDELVASLERSSDGAGGAARAFSQRTLPRIHELLDSLDTTARNVGRLVEALERDPGSVLVGKPLDPPGPGERGYRAKR